MIFRNNKNTNDVYIDFGRHCRELKTDKCRSDQLSQHFISNLVRGKKKTLIT